MKLFSYLYKKRIKSLVFCAAIVCSVVAQYTISTEFVSAVGETSETESTAPEGNELDPGNFLDEYVIYRWTPVTSTTMPGAEDDDWHLAMLFRVWDSNVEGPYMNGKVTERLYLGTNPKYTPEGYDRSNILTYKDGSPGWGKIEKNDVAESTTHYLKNKYVYGYNDNTVRPFDDVFYTADDRDCIAVKKVGVSTYRKNADGLGAYEYEIKFKSSNDNYEYYAWGNVDSDNDANFWALTEKDSAALAKTMKDKNYNEDYKTTNRFCFINYGTIDKSSILNDPLYSWNGLAAMGSVFAKNNSSNASSANVTDKETWNIVGEIKGHDSWLWASGSGEQDNTWWYFRDKKTDKSRFIWFNGERLSYSAFRSDLEMKNHMIMSITKNAYVGDDGQKTATQGVFLPNGKTITVNEGCVLSISGSFINNGTIIVNGGTLLIKDGGTVYPFLPGTNPSENGCGTIKCLGGDIIIEKGGALYGGLADENGAIVDFNLDNKSTLINQGLLVYGSMRLGSNTRIELYEDSYTYGGYYQMAFDIKGEENIRENKYSELSKKYAEQGYTLLGYRTTGSATNTKTGETIPINSYYFQQVKRLKPDEMLVECNDLLLEGKTEDCKCIYDAYRNLLSEIAGEEVDTNSTGWAERIKPIIGDKFGMRTDSEKVIIKVDNKAHFNDNFAKNDENITKLISELTL